MFSILKRMFRPRTESAAQLDALRSALSLKPNEMELSGLYPLFAPASFFETGAWPGPFESCRVPGLGLTWGIEQREQTMLYLSKAMSEYWTQAGIDWQQQAMQNLASRSDPTFCTGAFARAGESPAQHYAVVFMHNDGYGPSRLLFEEQLREIFPHGYLVALPEMSCGIALSINALPEERAKIETMIETCYRDGSRPLIPGLHHPSLLVSQ
jgi:hypothetical protein